MSFLPRAFFIRYTATPLQMALSLGFLRVFAATWHFTHPLHRYIPILGVWAETASSGEILHESRRELKYLFVDWLICSDVASCIGAYGAVLINGWEEAKKGSRDFG